MHSGGGERSNYDSSRGTESAAGERPARAPPKTSPLLGGGFAAQNTSFDVVYTCDYRKKKRQQHFINSEEQPLVSSKQAQIATAEDVKAWMAPAYSGDKVRIQPLYKMLCERLTDMDPDDIEDTLVEWLGDPSTGELPKVLRAELVASKILPLFDL